MIVSRLLQGAKRFGEIQQLIPGISAKVLSDSLEELERSGIVERSVTGSSRPVLIQYSLTNKGADLLGVLQKIDEWGRRWLAPFETPTSKADEDSFNISSPRVISS